MLYDSAYYQNIRQASESSAQVIVPLVTSLMAPRSVLDVGCGDGTWLNVYQENGAADCFGVDGSHVRDLLRITPTQFDARDLAKPFDLGRRFDLVQSLGVAEHLPPASAEGFVDSLVRHGDAILFSAAIPHQGGTGHVNEQWPDYWAELFQRAGFAVYDWVRPRIWGEERVAWWYTQNTLLFVRQGIPADWVKRLPRPVRVGPILRLVHPQQHLQEAEPSRIPDSTKTRSEQSRSIATTSTGPTRQYDVAVVIPTIGRTTLERAVRSIYTQAFPGTIQILVGIDGGNTPRSLNAVIADAPSNCAVTIFNPGYSTSVRHGGVHASRDGGALRTILSYAAHSRLVAYLDDDNWWAADHLSSLTAAVAGRGWAYSLRWYVDPQTATPLCVDRWESIGPDTGCYRERFGGWVDPNCLLLDKVACEPTLRLWSVPIPGDRTQLTGDRHVFADLRLRGTAGSTGRATVFYTINAEDVMHSSRLQWIATTQPSSSVDPALEGGTGGFTKDWFSHNLPVWKEHLLPLAGQPLQALEIGVFEGRSAVWLLEHVLTHPASMLTWVDTFQGSSEHTKLDLSRLEARFRANIARFDGKTVGHVGRSQDVLRKLSGEQFNLIYIDGSHEAADVLADAVLAWPLLRPGGLLGFDDYRWREFPEPERCPGVAIDGFLTAHKGRYKEIHRGYQLWIQKIC